MHIEQITLSFPTNNYILSGRTKIVDIFYATLEDILAYIWLDTRF